MICAPRAAAKPDVLDIAASLEHVPGVGKLWPQFVGIGLFFVHGLVGLCNAFGVRIEQAPLGGQVVGFVSAAATASAQLVADGPPQFFSASFLICWGQADSRKARENDDSSPNQSTHAWTRLAGV